MRAYEITSSADGKFGWRMAVHQGRFVIQRIKDKGIDDPYIGAFGAKGTHNDDLGAFQFFQCTGDNGAGHIDLFGKLADHQNAFILADVTEDLPGGAVFGIGQDADGHLGRRHLDPIPLGVFISCPAEDHSQNAGGDFTKNSVILRKHLSVRMPGYEAGNVGAVPIGGEKGKIARLRMLSGGEQQAERLFYGAVHQWAGEGMRIPAEPGISGHSMGGSICRGKTRPRIEMKNIPFRQTEAYVAAYDPGKGRFHIGQRDILKQLLTEQSIELVDAGKQGFHRVLPSIRANFVPSEAYQFLMIL